ncbi:phosphoesterase [Oceanobacillus oncorhynchi subsp. incaldanensis]|uniref:Putative metallophosphoesterase n=1 Tax=Oceanobacillus oncorhynchi TaxID=545501 RepID=A0A0A1MVC8_9BACI|nr:metallophosphoesterase [Oceanobacillus oncorhynchi]GIO19945.1 phosphoesterase [Oceanobacillus oncorhynchi subsp. incaldanensis]CEI83397.1 putative metallophosphoesterase [Oceanobacillus oncorhynchi]
MKRTKKTKNNLKRGIILSVLLLAMLSLLIKVYFDTNTFKINREQFSSVKLEADKELSVLQITDVHSRLFGEDNERVLEKARELDADIIVLTGDLIDRKTEDLEIAFELAEALVQVNPDTYFVTGNHEHENPEKEAFLAGLEKRGVRILSNEHTQFEKDGQLFNMVGVNDVSTNHEDMSSAFSNVDTDKYTILLSHAPAVIQKYPEVDADIVLSGHTHGGQVRLPFIGALVAPDEGLLPELQKGVYPLGDARYLYIDSGLGTSALPIRFLNQSQISLITIQPEQ